MPPFIGGAGDLTSWQNWRCYPRPRTCILNWHTDRALSSTRRRTLLPEDVAVASVYGPRHAFLSPKRSVEPATMPTANTGRTHIANHCPYRRTVSQVTEPLELSFTTTHPSRPRKQVVRDRRRARRRAAQPGLAKLASEPPSKVPGPARARQAGLPANVVSLNALSARAARPSGRGSSRLFRQLFVWQRLPSARGCGCELMGGGETSMTPA